MMIRLLGLLLGLCCLQAAGQEPEAAANNAYLLLNVEASGPLSIRELEFTNLDSGQTVMIRDITDLGRYTGKRFFLQPLPAGSYYLSAIYPSYNRIDASPPIKISEEGGIITISPDTINYIGDLIIETRDRGVRTSTNFSYEPNSRTLVHAATSEPELFQRLPTVVSIAGHYPIPVEKRLLGL